ncbi:hypothetical protein K470DRAFT_278961 [Piedraia hortae CBS 480.64]|uniref:CNH domain-containing protein n=1 Tax=Piedraia hortae CBS 480.64 TaxID=1314780 RepID=A0A6A7BT56_9PEZI|nr:hypothetical protein K470DRAFT_278961 [Piedraia hortae CBS 480.64]
MAAFDLQPLLGDVPLDGDEITCVDAWNGNVYVGTVAGAVLHYVAVDGGYMFASRLKPPYATKQEGKEAGVRQIVLLPRVAKACILCNDTLCFYTLPELSPAFGSKIQQNSCLFVCSTDDSDPAGTAIVICLRQRLRLIRIGYEARKIRDIDLGGISIIQRRGDLACLADGRLYSLIDLANQRKSELFPISSLDSSSLPPNIVSPTPTEFLLTTGTQLNEPGVGMFVNTDGDVVRGSIEFSSYPEALVLDEGGFVLALVDRGSGKEIEVQRWDLDLSAPKKEWLAAGAETGVGLCVASSPTSLAVPGVTSSLRRRRLNLTNEPNNAEDARNKEEDEFVSRFSRTQASILLYHGDKISWVVRYATISSLEPELDAAVQRDKGLEIDTKRIQKTIDSIQRMDAQNELDFLTLTYVRQKASLLLFGVLLLETSKDVVAQEAQKKAAEELLMAGAIDPRTVLSLVTPLEEEVVQGPQGIWIPEGLCKTIFSLRSIVEYPKETYNANILLPCKRYLQAWRGKKGFGSVADEASVSQSVDAALVHVLLILDQDSPRGPAKPGSIRSELNELIDKGIDAFDRAKELFEAYSRLYLLSRLYQSCKMPARVLSTWKRIIEGTPDSGGELDNTGEVFLRRYLAKIRDAALVKEYGVWLAKRNPALSVNFFADETARVQFSHDDALTLLGDETPIAKKMFLELLVLERNESKYIDDLVALYLKELLATLHDDDNIRTAVEESYEVYNSLPLPRGTYLQYISSQQTDDNEWWTMRTNLLMLLSRSSSMDAFESIAEYSSVLVPEWIIILAIQGKATEALRLLVTHLGDYDTAIRFCLSSGKPDIFSPSSTHSALRAPFPPRVSSRPLQEAKSSAEESKKLFRNLLSLLLALPDRSLRHNISCHVINTFFGPDEVDYILEIMPEDCPLESLTRFWERTLRDLVSSKRESLVVKALMKVTLLGAVADCADAASKARCVVVNE